MDIGELAGERDNYGSVLSAHPDTRGGGHLQTAGAQPIEPPACPTTALSTAPDPGTPAELTAEPSDDGLRPTSSSPYNRLRAAVSGALDDTGDVARLNARLRDVLAEVRVDTMDDERVRLQAVFADRNEWWTDEGELPDSAPPIYPNTLALEVRSRKRSSTPRRRVSCPQLSRQEQRNAEARLRAARRRVRSQIACPKLRPVLDLRLRRPTITPKPSSKTSATASMAVPISV